MSGFDLSNFLASFFDEARERLSSINQALVKFEAGDLSDDDMVALRRDAHTIKGSALMLGVTDIGETAHLFEDMMEQLMEHPSWRSVPSMTQFLYDIHDALDDRLKDTDNGQVIDVAPLKANQKYLLDHVDEALEPSIANMDAPMDLQDTEKTPIHEAPTVADTLTHSTVEPAQSILEAPTNEDEQGLPDTQVNDDIPSIDISMDGDLDHWLDSNSIDLDASLLHFDDVVDDKIISISAKSSQVPDPVMDENSNTQASGLIGGDEAAA